MPGGKPWAQRGTVGSGETVAVTNRPEVNKVSADQTTSLASGASHTTEIYAPTGSIYYVVAAHVFAPNPGGAASGSHRFLLKTIDNLLRVLRGESTYSTRLLYRYGVWRDADNAQYPSTEAAQSRQVQTLEATENSPIVVEYTNDTDVSQDNTREITFVVEEESY